MWNETIVGKFSFALIAFSAMVLCMILGKQISPWGASIALVFAWIVSGFASYRLLFSLKTAMLLLIPGMLITSYLLFDSYLFQFQQALATLPITNTGDKMVGTIKVIHFFSFMWLPAVLLILFVTAIITRYGYKLQSRDIFGSASLANSNDYHKMGLYKSSGILLGKDYLNRLLRTPKLTSRLIIAPSGKGKGVSVIIPTLLTENRPIVTLDPKGENWAVSARQRISGFKTKNDKNREVIALDPFRIRALKEFKNPKIPKSAYKHFSFNPLDSIRRNKFKRSRDISTLVKALVMTDPTTAIPNRWEAYAKIIIEGLIHYVLDTVEDPTLLHVHSCLTLSPEETDELWRLMYEHGGHARAAVSIILKVGPDERGSLISSTYEHLHWLVEPNLQSTIEKTNFSFEKLLTGEEDIFIIMPEDQITEHARYIRLILTCIISFLQQQPPHKKPKTDILFLLEELGQLSYCEPIEAAITILRARGAQIWAVFQSRDQTKIYKKPKVFEDMDVKQFFGIDDIDTLEWINALGGKKTETSKSVSKSTQSNSSFSNQLGKSHSEQETSTELFPINVLRELPSDEQIVFISGQKPIRCKRLTYWKEPSLEGTFDANPLETRTNQS